MGLATPIGLACLIFPEMCVSPYRDTPHRGHSKPQSPLPGSNCACLKMLLGQSPLSPATPEWGPGSVLMPPVQDCFLPVGLRDQLGGWGSAPPPQQHHCQEEQIPPSSQELLI